MICRPCLIKLDKLANGLLLGDPKQTISCRIGILSKKGNKIAKLLALALGMLDKDHCERAVDDPTQNGIDDE